MFRKLQSVKHQIQLKLRGKQLSVLIYFLIWSLLMQFRVTQLQKTFTLQHFGHSDNIFSSPPYMYYHCSPLILLTRNVYFLLTPYLNHTWTHYAIRLTKVQVSFIITSWANREIDAHGSLIKKVLFYRKTDIAVIHLFYF